MPYTRTIPIALGTSKAGLALQAQLRQNGVDAGAPITTGFDDTGAGTYTWTYAGFADGQTYTVKIADQAAPGVTLAATVVEPDLSLLNRLAGGGGAVLFQRTIAHAVTGQPLDGVQAWVTTSSDPTANIVASDTSDADGLVEFMLDAGTYWLWQQLAGFNTPAPTQITVS